VDNLLGRPLEVEVRDSLEKAMKILKQKMSKEGILQEVKRRRFYVKRASVVVARPSAAAASRPTAAPSGRIRIQAASSEAAFSFAAILGPGRVIFGASSRA
jgi:ribosomal protein S21